MTSSFQSRLGTAPEEAIKAPTKVASDTNITLSGEQTITDVDAGTTAVVAGDRVLVANQTDATENGIYVVKSGAWERATDWNANDDVVNGVLVAMTDQEYLARGTFTGDFTIDVTEVSFDYLPLVAQADITSAVDSANAAAASATAAAASATAASDSASSASSDAQAAANSAATLVEGRYTRAEFVATASQTNFTVPGGYDTGYVEVSVNGAALESAEFDDSTSPDVVITPGLAAGDRVIIIAWGLLAATANYLVTTNNLSDLTSASAARTALGLGDSATGTIGTDVQAQDDQLQAIADSTPAANKMTRWTGATTADLIDFLDEDNMASDSATAVASQQSIKKYVDDQVGAGSGIGTGQTLTDVKSSRALNTQYTNSTGKPIFVYVSVVYGAYGIAEGFVDGQRVFYMHNQFGDRIGRTGFQLLVPDGSTYKANATNGGATIDEWRELR